MATFNAGKIQATAELDRTPFQRSLDAAIREGRRFDGTTWTANLDLDYRQVDRKLAIAKAKLDEYARKKYTAKLDVDRSHFSQAVDAAARDLEKVGGGSKNVRIKADLDNQSVLQKLDEIRAAGERTADSIGSGFTSQFQKIKFAAIFGGITLGAAAAAPSLIGLAGALGVVATGAVGVGAAVKAYAKEQKKADDVSAAGAKSEASNAIAIRNANQAIADARKQAARSAEDSAERVDNAKRQEVRAAEDVVRAQKDIAEARKEATRALEDAIDKQAGYALSQEAATVALMRAVENQQKVNQDAASTDLDRREAALGVAEAQQRLADLTKQHARDTEDLNELQAKGVEGSDQVTAATDRYKNAQESLADAQRATQDAEKDAARARADGAEAVSRAVQNLKDVQAQQAASAGAAAAKNNEYQEALKKLSPAGQQLVKTLIGLKGEYDRLSSVSQSALFPGVNRALQSLHSLEPAATAGLRSLGGAMSDSADKAADLFNSPVFQGKLEQALKNGTPVVSAFGDSLVTVIDDLTDFGSKAGPAADGVGQMIRNLTSGFGDFFHNLEPNIQDTGKLFEDLGTIGGEVFSALGQFTSQFSGAWARVRGDVMPVIQQILDTFLQFTGGAFHGFTDGLKVIADVVGGLLKVIQPFAGILGNMYGLFAAASLGAKVFGGPLGSIVNLFSKLNPSNVEKKLLALAPAFTGVGDKAKAAGKDLESTEGKTSKFSSALGKVTGGVIAGVKNIPLLGAVVIGLKSIYDSFVPSADELSKSILEGGQAAVDAQQKIKDNHVNLFDVFEFDIGPGEQGVKDKIKELTDAMTPLQRAQQFATQSQNDYTYAVKKFGQESPEAQTAAIQWKGATEEVAQAQWEAEQKTKSATQAMKDQEDQMLGAAGSQIGYERAVANLNEAHQRYNDTLKDTKATEADKKQAELDYRQALLDTVSAAEALAGAQTAGLSPAQQTAAQTDAVNRQLLTLSAQAGEKLPADLQTMINKMDKSAWAAYGVTYKVDEMGNKIATLPPSTPVNFTSNAPSQAAAVQGLADAVDRVKNAYTRWMDSYLDLVTNVNANPLPMGGMLPLGGNAVPYPQGRATGGYFDPGTPTWVGEKGPELVFPTRASYVATAEQSNAIVSGFASSQGAATDTSGLEQLLGAILGQLQAGQRVTFDSNSLETGLIRANRRRDSR